jgi:Ca2+-binding EF-hand superfamily protein
MHKTCWFWGLATVLLAAPSLRGQDGELFTRLDKNSDGFVTAEEVPDEHKALFERLLKRAGREEEKKLSRVLFLAALQAEGGAPREATRTREGADRRLGETARQSLDTLFDRTDANSDGALTKEEVPESRRLLRMVFDRAGKESVTKAEFVRLMSELQAEQPGRFPGAPPDAGNQRPGRPPGEPGPGGPPGGLFAVLDTDHDGQLSTSEIVAAGSVLLRMDRNGDSRLTPDEVFTRTGGPPPGAPRGEGRPFDRPREPGGPPRAGDRPPGGPGPEAFRERLREADRNGDGKLSKDEAPDQLKENFDRADANGDGVLDETELRAAFERLRGGEGRPAARP